MQFAGLGSLGRIATRLATWFAPPYYGRCYLARLNPKGYISHLAVVHHDSLSLGKHVFIGDRVTIFKDEGGGPIEIGERVHLYGNTYIQTGFEGIVRIGSDTHIQPGCQFSAYKGSILIGKNVEIAPGCAFYSYDHSFSPGEVISRQPLFTKGDIQVGNGAWLGFGVIVLSGVRIGKGAVVGAGSIVTHDIPDDAIAVGRPVRVIKMRNELVPKKVNAVDSDNAETLNTRI